MMNYFCQVGTVWQVVLLVLSLLTVISLTGGCTLLFRHRYNAWKKIALVVVLLLLNATLYVLMQVDSRITGVEHSMHLPYVMLLVVTLLSFAFSVWFLLNETKNRKTINNTSIKEAFDNLPTGVCFFNEVGLPVLCNRTMQRFSFAVTGKDVQFITDLKRLYDKDFVPNEDVTRDGKVFTLYGGTAWQLEKRVISDGKQGYYTQFIAFDVTDLHNNRVELTQENAELRRVQAELKRLSANVVAITREEEILNTKMRVHDEMGRCLVEAQKYLRDDADESIPESVVYSWRRAVSMLKYNNETDEDNMMEQIIKTCESLRINFVQTGKLPEEEKAAYILTCAVRECVTNAVRYADASELYAEFTQNDEVATVSISNNGKRPEALIVEGGGLSTLRRRVERAGGTMSVHSLPEFRLTVTVPKEKEGVL